MKKLLFLTILATLSYATNLLTHNIYDRDDRVDIMLSFDSPYSGKIFQDKNANDTILKLQDLNFNKSIKKSIRSNIIQTLSIKPVNNDLVITLGSKQDIAVTASKTTDGFGLRIRTRLAATTPVKTIQETTKTKDTDLQNIAPFKDSSLIDTRYVIVVSFLFILLIIMLWVKKRVAKNPPSPKQKSWLFKGISQNSINIKILHKKPIDTKNSIMLIEFENKRYLVMSGNSNVLLDTFGQNDLEDSSDFEQAFEDNRKKLDDYLKLQDGKLASYKDKASGENFFDYNL